MLRRVPLVLVLVLLGVACTLQRPDPRDPFLELAPRPGAFAVRAPAPATATAPAAAPATFTATSTATPLRVATYNVHMQSGPAIARAIRARPELLAVDVWLLQEIERPGEGHESEASRLARALDMAYVYAPVFGTRGGGSHGLAILSRYPLADVRVVALPSFPVVVNAGPRLALGATLEVGGAEIRVYSVHLDNRLRPDQRVEQLRPLVEEEPPDPGAVVVIGGDFNTSPFTWRGYIVPWPSGRSQEARVEGFLRGHGFDAATRGAGPTTAWLRMRLDAIFTRNAAVLARGVDRAVMVSDHFPLWIDLAPAPAAAPARVSTR